MYQACSPQGSISVGDAGESADRFLWGEIVVSLHLCVCVCVCVRVGGHKKLIRKKQGVCAILQHYLWTLFGISPSLESTWLPSNKWANPTLSPKPPPHLIGWISILGEGLLWTVFIMQNSLISYYCFGFILNAFYLTFHCQFITKQAGFVIGQMCVVGEGTLGFISLRSASITLRFINHL